MSDILGSILTADFWVGFVGAVIATAFLTQPIMDALYGPLRISRRIVGPCVAILVGTGVALVWAGGATATLLRDGIIYGTASTAVYENVIKPWVGRRSQGLGNDPEIIV